MPQEEQNTREHHDIMLQLQSLSDKLDNTIKWFSEAAKKSDKHIAESTELRIDIHDNTKFRGGATKALWVVYSLILTVLSKVFLFK